MSELAIYRVGELVATFCFINCKVLAAEWHDKYVQTKLNTADNVVYIKSPSGCCKLGKSENVEYLTFL